MHDLLIQELNTLPPGCRGEIRSILDAYSGVPGDFFRLFYVPVYSFLKWLPLHYGSGADPDFMTLARRGQSLSLALHLWDDHLCDGQLSIDPLRLQTRTLLYNGFLDACQGLCRILEKNADVVRQELDVYLVSVHGTREVKSLEDYCARFLGQIAIWKIVPRLLSEYIADGRIGSDLIALLDRFTLSWRILDDIQDLEEDIRQKKKTAVWWKLDASGRRRWQDCADGAARGTYADPTSWKALAHHIQHSGCLDGLLAGIRENLEACSRICRFRNWPEMDLEIIALGSGLPKFLKD